MPPLPIQNTQQDFTHYPRRNYNAWRQGASYGKLCKLFLSKGLHVLHAEKTQAVEEQQFQLGQLE